MLSEGSDVVFVDGSQPKQDVQQLVLDRVLATLGTESEVNV